MRSTCWVHGGCKYPCPSGPVSSRSAFRIRGRPERPSLSASSRVQVFAALTGTWQHASKVGTPGRLLSTLHPGRPSLCGRAAKPRCVCRHTSTWATLPLRHRSRCKRGRGGPHLPARTRRKGSAIIKAAGILNPTPMPCRYRRRCECGTPKVHLRAGADCEGLVVVKVAGGAVVEQPGAARIGPGHQQAHAVGALPGPLGGDLGPVSNLAHQPGGGHGRVEHKPARWPGQGWSLAGCTWVLRQAFAGPGAAPAHWWPRPARPARHELLMI